MKKRESTPAGFIELVIDPKLFSGSKPEKRKKFAECVHEVANISGALISRLVYFDPYMASSLTTSMKYLEIIEEVKQKFGTNEVVLIGSISKGSFSNVILPSGYVGTDCVDASIHDRFILLLDADSAVVAGVTIGCSINSVIGKDSYGINKLPEADNASWFSKIRNLL